MPELERVFVEISLVGVGLKKAGKESCEVRVGEPGGVSGAGSVM